MQNRKWSESRTLPPIMFLLTIAISTSSEQCRAPRIDGALPTSNHREPYRCRWSRTLLGLALVLSICLLSRSLHAQEFRANITGQVTDSTGAALSGASITAVNNDTNVPSSTTTDKQGHYSLLYLLPGTYTVTVTATNFQQVIYNKVALQSAQELGMNITLKPGNATQQVVVTESPVDLDTVSASTEGVIDRMKVANMPSAGLLIFDDVLFVQGVRDVFANPFNVTPRATGTFYTVSGAQTDENSYYLNGAPVSDGGTWYFVPSEQATSQVQVSAMPYDAQYGRIGGGAINANVKNGTNDFHGSVYEYYGNQALNANTWISDLHGIRKPINIRSTYGADVGGPIRKNKTFFFTSFEGFTQHEPTAETETVPPTAWRTGNFAGSGYTIYDPLSTYCATKNSSGGCTAYARKPFLNDVIPSSRMSSIGQAILAMYPTPQVSTTISNYFVTEPVTYGYKQYIIRIDQNLSEKTTIYGLFTHNHDQEYTAGNDFSNAAITSTNPTSNDYNIITDLTHIFSPSMVLDLKASYGHSSSLAPTGVALQENFLASKLGLTMPAVGTTSHQNIVPSISVASMAPLFGNTGNGSADADADFSGSMTQVLGPHNLHYGAEFMDAQSAPSGVLGDPNGTFAFNSAYTQEDPFKAVTGQGNEVADILLGYPASGSVTWITPTFITQHYYGLFMQDDYKVLPSLSLNLGVRWDVNMSPRDRHDRINAGFCLTCTNPYTSQINYAKTSGLPDPLLGGWQFAGVNGAPSSPFSVHWRDWQPRVGFSWAAFRDTVIRGGYGIFYPWVHQGVDDVGYSQATSFVSTLDGGLTPDAYFNSGTPFPGGAIAPSGSSEGLETNAGNGANFQDPSSRVRMTQHWTFGFQRRMPFSTLLDVQYAGTTVHAIPMSTSLGIISTTLQQACNLDISKCNTNVSNPFYGVLPSTVLLGASPTIPAWQLQRNYPLFDGVTNASAPTGSTHYNALNVWVNRTVSNLNFVLSYSYANWIDRDSYLNNGAFRDSNPTKNLDFNDVRHYVAVNIVYPIPGTRMTGLLGALVNGWLVDSTIITRTGTPLSLPSATLTGAPGCTSYAPIGGQNHAHWFNNNENCWTTLGPWQPRTTPLNVGFIRNPPYTMWNPAFHKQFKLPREGTLVQFRIEGLNGANHPIWNAPDENLTTPPSYSPKTGWTGFGTLTGGQGDTSRQLFASLTILF